MLLSLDISTSCTGIALFDENNKLHELSHLKFKSKKGIFDKLREFIEFFEQYASLDITEIVIEEPLQMFKGKFSSAHTIAILNFFNGMISSYLYNKFNIEPLYYNVKTARKTVFPNLVIPNGTPNSKYLVWQAMVNLYPTINWEYGKKSHKLASENFDMVDAAVVGLAHIVSVIKSKTKEEV